MVNKQQSIKFKGIPLDVTYTHFITSRNEDFVRVTRVIHNGEDITPLINVLISIELEKQLIKELTNE